MKKILMVEDDPFIAYLHQTYLEKLGYELIDTTETFEATLEAFNNQKPDIILMDIRIEGKRDGIETALAIREKSEVPIIFISGNSDKTSTDRIVGISNHHFMVKPITKEKLNHILDQC